MFYEKSYGVHILIIQIQVQAGRFLTPNINIPFDM